MDSIIEGVIAKIKQRSERGLSKYGVGLDRTDLTVQEWLQHAQDELLDGANYLEKLIRLNGTCRWTQFTSGCNESVDVFYGVIGIAFCPFCGRKIEVAR